LPVDGKKVIEYRVTLGQKERDLLEAATTGYTINKVGDPIIKLLSDGTALAAIFVIMTSIFPRWSENLPDGWEDTIAGMTVTEVVSWVDNLEDYASGPSAITGFLGGLGGALVGGPVGAAFGATGGVAVGETAESLYENRVGLFYTLMMLGSRAAKKIPGVD
jgi:hypothetical protein